MRSCFVAFVLLGVSQLAFSQGFGTIVGTVTDPSSASVASAKVSVVDPATGTSRQAVTNAAGGFVIPALRPSSYTLTVEAPGFNTYTQGNILLTADQSATVNVSLALGQATQTVTVETSVVQTDTYTSTIKEVVDQQRIVDLPLNGRNAAALTTLVPGAVISPNGGADQGQTKTFPGAVTISTNGSRQNMVAYNLDGGNNVDGYTNVNMPFPFPDALQEFSVQTANYSAEYGGNAGGVVNVVTKSGTNAIHGDFFAFVRNGAFNARNFFSSAVDPLHRWQEGGTIGGPIRKDKTFFFAGYQGTTIRSVSQGTNSGNSFVPTIAEQAGDFSTYLNASDPNNPLHKQVILKNPATGLPFAGNIIPTNLFDKAAVGTMKYLPSVGGTGTVFYTTPIHQNFNEFLGRIDHTVSDKDRLTARYYYDRFSNQPVYTAANILSYADGSLIRTENALLQEVHIFNPSLLNDFRVAYSRDAAERGPAGNVPSVRDFGVSIPYQPPANDVQSISVSGFFKFGDNPHARFTRNNFMWSDDLRWVFGRHNISAGGDFERRRVDLDNGFNSPGLFTFSGSSVGNSTGLALADFVLGDLNAFQQAKGQYENTRVWAMGFYVQDNYHVSSRLTLNLGLRYEPYWPWHEIKGRVEGFSIPNYVAGITSKVYTNAPPGLLFRGDAGLPENGVGNNFKDFAPRVGFAYDVTGNGKTSVRGGAGMFYDSRSSGIFNNNMVDVSPFSPNLTLTPPPGPYSNPLAGQSVYANIFPGVFPPPSNVSFPLPISAQTFNLGNSSFQVPVIYNWNLAVEHQFGNQWLGRVAYVGSHATHLSLNTELNPAVYIPGGNNSKTDPRRIFQPYASIPYSDQSGNSNYNSLQVTIQKRLAHGVSILANYSYQKTLDNVAPSNGQTGATTTGGGSNPPYPWYMAGNKSLDYGPSDFNRQHVFVLSYVWLVPSPHTSNKLIKNILGDWEITGIISKETGLPFTIFSGKDNSFTGLGSDRAVYTGGNPYGSTACLKAPCVSWLNPNAFSVNPIGTFGNVGKGALTGPGLFNWDMGAFKNITITERWRAQLRGEFFNTFNHTNLTNSSNNYPIFGVSSGGFGTILAAGDPRIIQLAMKVVF